MKLDFEYGHGLMSAELPDNTDVFIPGTTVADPPCIPEDKLEEAYLESLRHPIGMKPLSELAFPGAKVVFIVPDRVKGGEQPTSHRKVSIKLILKLLERKRRQNAGRSRKAVSAGVPQLRQGVVFCQERDLISVRIVAINAAKGCLAAGKRIFDRKPVLLQKRNQLLRTPVFLASQLRLVCQPIAEQGKLWRILFYPFV